MQIKFPLQLRFAMLSCVSDVTAFDVIEYVTTIPTTIYITYNIRCTPPTMPSIGCPDGDPGDAGELEFELYFDDLHVDCDKLAEWAFDEIYSIICEELQKRSV